MNREVRTDHVKRDEGLERLEQEYKNFTAELVKALSEGNRSNLSKQEVSRFASNLAEQKGFREPLHQIVKDAIQLLGERMRPQMNVFAGGYGCGKSRVEGTMQHTDAPHYGSGGPGQEMKNLSQIQECIQKGRSVSFETCLPKEALDLMWTAKKEGYEVDLHFVKTEHAAEGYHRGLKSGAITPKDLPAIMKGNDLAFRNLETAISLSDCTTIYNNRRGEELRVENAFQNGRWLWRGNPPFDVPPGIKECSLREDRMSQGYQNYADEAIKRDNNNPVRSGMYCRY